MSHRLLPHLRYVWNYWDARDISHYDARERNSVGLVSRSCLAPAMTEFARPRLRPINMTDPSFSALNQAAIPPRQYAIDYIDFICRLERLDSRGACLYLVEPGYIVHPCLSMHRTLPRSPQDCGFDWRRPLLVVLKNINRIDDFEVKDAGSGESAAVGTERPTLTRREFGPNVIIPAT